MRLGDDIDDHCSRCKRTTDHSIVSMMGEEVLQNALPHLQQRAQISRTTKAAAKR